ncbi:unnamed protein product [Lactuca saligna]|uniref:TIR domain-containing protein n=1 Tax=Lactuca saligna TaxID=75948 RepID=A0AA35YDN4_LACSI|nr:unnamed protein product [Lactuca saligna]
MDVPFSEGSSSSSINNHKHDVFISFRGEDTRRNFIDHLNKTLQHANISTFLDEEKIDTGKVLKPELVNAIKSSRASIIVLSKNYASSSWCLDELVLILKQPNQIVIPIFYHVEPTHVRKQESTFGDAIAEHTRQMKAEKDADERTQSAQRIKGWIDALKQVANLKGEDVRGWYETVFIKKIVDDLNYRLHVPSRSALPEPIGMKDSINFVTSWLKKEPSDRGDVLTIFGMRGIGKTSLAQYVHGLHCYEFVTSSFIKDIDRRCDDKLYGLRDIAAELYGCISKGSSTQDYDVSKYTSKIENIVANEKVFLVLDDINTLDQLNALLGRKGFYQGSKIIITTRNTWLTESCDLFKTEVKPTHEKHKLEGLDDTEALELFCSHAFKSKDPKKGYGEMSEKFVNYCRGHRLTLEVLGMSLYNRQDVAYWEDRIEGLGKDPVENELRKSFDSLPSDNDKELFKHIACFFVGTDRVYTETILKACKIRANSGITDLMDNCLLSVGWNNELVMHQLLQEMGRHIVRQESPDKAWKRSRLWCHEESFKVLKEKKGTRKVLGLSLDIRRLEINEPLETEALRKMDELKLLQLNCVQMNGSYENFPKQLRWLCMHVFPLDYIPSNLPMKYLVALDMSYSNITSFGVSYCDSQPQKRQRLTGSCSKDKKLLGSLKILNLSFCDMLCSVVGFEDFPALERNRFSSKPYGGIRKHNEYLSIKIDSLETNMQSMIKTIGIWFGKKIRAACHGTDRCVFRIGCQMSNDKSVEKLVIGRRLELLVLGSELGS